ncbi:hypothetical protein WR25_26223 [Diploscapter pachys]|uniref:Uncharacterized protein n=1 Tax=Diploscapter pachys TaxID=2018661 RepID=A0A2A2LR08_9BILA|nr:hypothetical protein WR25_26223 [Diploscapter pachys]
MEGSSPAEALEQNKNDWWSIYRNTVRFFICVQLVNFYVLPLHYRVFWVQSAALIWQTYYSYITQKKRAEK